MSIRPLVCALLVAAAPRAAAGQESLTLGAAQAAAVAADPRAARTGIAARQTELRLRTIASERLPAVSLHGQGQYQSTVFALPFAVPGGGPPLALPHDSYDAHLQVRQSLYDAGLGARAAVEQARLAQLQSGVEVALQQSRQAVAEAFFLALRLEAQRDEVDAGILDLEARLALARDREQARAALPGEAAGVEAELLRRGQLRTQIDAQARSARTLLADLTGRPGAASAPLVLPDLVGAFARARAEAGELRARPEYDRFAAEREVLEREMAAATAGVRPRVSAFGRAGYGRPGLNPTAVEFDEYWLTGVQVEWTPWRWGAAGRERAVGRLQQSVVDIEESAFSDALRRSAISLLASAERVAGALEQDDRIVGLRETILAEARLRFDEGVITAPEYVDRETDLLEARLSRTGHRIELAEVHARFLILYGIPIP